MLQIVVNAKLSTTKMFVFLVKANMEYFKLLIVWNVGKIADYVKEEHPQLTIHYLIVFYLQNIRISASNRLQTQINIMINILNSSLNAVPMKNANKLSNCNIIFIVILLIMKLLILLQQIK